MQAARRQLRRQLGRLLLCTCGASAGAAAPRRRILSGIQPTGAPHLGNYLGAISHWLRLCSDQSAWDAPSLFCIVDLHALTAGPDPAELRRLTTETAASLVACGLLDPPGVRLFCQSQVPGHADLHWVLGSLCPLARLQHLPNWREKPYGNAAIFTYPVLQAADILLYRATHVPVGADQLMHVELSRDLATRFNSRYGCKIFSAPEPLLPTLASAGRVRSLRDPARKMSKSDPDPRSRIGLADSPDEIRAKLRAAVTDSTPGVAYDPASRPGLAALIELLAAVTDCRPEEALARHGPPAAVGKGELKALLAEAVVERLRPIRQRYLEAVADPEGAVAPLLRAGREAATAEAAATMAEVRRLTGLT